MGPRAKFVLDTWPRVYLQRGLVWVPPTGSQRLPLGFAAYLVAPSQRDLIRNGTNPNVTLPNIDFPRATLVPSLQLACSRALHINCSFPAAVFFCRRTEQRLQPIPGPSLTILVGLFSPFPCLICF